MMPKARELAQHGGLPGWLEESDPAGVILYLKDRPYRLPLLSRTGCPDRSCQLNGISSCCFIVNVHNHSSSATVHHARMAWPSTQVL
jgi:hypothetical protein